MSNRTKAGFGQPSKIVLTDQNIDLKLKGLYAYLSAYASNTTDETYVSVDRIAAETGTDRSTINRLLKALIEKGVISRTRRGKNTTAITKLLK